MKKLTIFKVTIIALLSGYALFGLPFVGHVAFGQSAQYRWHDGVALPDAAVSPGVVRTTDVNEVCNGGSTKQFRHTTAAMKAKIYAEYGIDKRKIDQRFCRPPVSCDAHPKGPLYEIDHEVSLELGGADDVRNLFPQPYFASPGAHAKDQLENFLHHHVCVEKDISLSDAQSMIRTDWYAAYLKLVAKK